jgi:methyl-accepting chemotaxis protein
MRQNRLTLGVKIGITTGVLTCLLVLIGWYGLHSIGAIDGLFQTTANKTVRKALLFGELGQAVSDMAAGERGLLAFTYAKDPVLQADARQLFQTSTLRVQAAVTEIQPMLVMEEGNRALEDINSRMSQWLPAFNDFERLLESGDADGATKLLNQRITPQYLGVSEDCRRLAVLINQALQSDKQTVQDQYASARWFMILLMLGAAAAALAAFWVARSVTGRLRRLAAASEQVASASQSLAQGTSQQAATLEETSSSTSEITSIARKNSENTRTVTGLMEETARLVQGANHNLEEMVQSMKEINGSSEKISKIINKILLGWRFYPQCFQ